MRKRALIIGGSSGIGLATVKKLALNSFDVVVLHRDRRQDVEKLQQELGDLSKAHNASIQSHNIDATNEEKISDFVSGQEGSDPFDLVLHAVSRGNLKPMIETDNQLSNQDFKLTLDAMGVNLHTWVAQLANQKLISNQGRIVALTSEGNKRVWKGYGAVASAKATLETIANYLAVEMAPMGINVNIIQAGITDTPSLRMIPGSEKLIAETKSRNPFGRLTTPEDVANVIYLLTQPEAGWINGSLIHVDGGEHLV
ncbi:MAG: SDR family oxidoreductase [Ekhidna sp.]